MVTAAVSIAIVVSATFVSLAIVVGVPYAAGTLATILAGTLTRNTLVRRHRKRGES
ncbi:hypothetical protein [Amycolatopsis sp. NPDC059021]|uniref:hypothetical protein n=1 Tax=Amycolatopsis sp. NPDC059021 TaxID=3346704 RepID=UPI00366CD7E7